MDMENPPLLGILWADAAAGRVATDLPSSLNDEPCGPASLAGITHLPPGAPF